MSLPVDEDRPAPDFEAPPSFFRSTSVSFPFESPLPLQLLATQQQKDKANKDQLKAMGGHLSNNDDENDNNDPDNDDAPEYTEEEINEWLEQNYDEFYESLTDEQREYFEYYKGQEEFDDDEDDAPSKDEAHFISHEHDEDALDSSTLDYG